MWTSAMAAMVAMMNRKARMDVILAGWGFLIRGRTGRCLIRATEDKIWMLLAHQSTIPWQIASIGCLFVANTAQFTQNFRILKMVLPVWIEHTTSPLPRE